MKQYYLFAQKLDPGYLPKPSESLNDIINFVFAIFGAIAVLIVVYAGVQLILSNGNAEKVATSRRTIIYAIVGLIVMSLAWVIVGFVVKRLA